MYLNRVLDQTRAFLYSFTRNFPQTAISVNIGKSSLPLSVREYSTLGGDSAKAIRSTNPSRCISLNCVVSTFRESWGMAASNCPNRFDDLFKLMMIKGFHFPPITEIACVKEHSGFP